jgi:uncharacterized protein DUF4349
MPSPELLAPDRAERLLAGSPPETAREADVERIVRELRALAAPAPRELCERVRSLDAPRAPRRRWLVPVLATAAILASVFAAVAFVAREGSGERDAREGGTTQLLSGGDVGGSGEKPALAPEPTSGAGPDSEEQGFSTGALAKDRRSTLSSGGVVEEAAGPSRDAERAQDVDLLLALRLKDADALSAAANDALQITDDLGGVVASSNVDSAGREGTARLELSIPTRRLDQAIVRLSALGTITEQRIATRDLQGGIDRRSRRIEQLRTAIRADELRLASGTLDAVEKLEVELRLLRERGLLRELNRERTRLLREAAYAEVTLALHTREASGAPAPEGGIGGAARDALDTLGRAGEIAVFAGILLAPLLALAVLIWIALRARRRRIDARLLEQPRPAAPPQP